ncbi:MAG: GNAT family acetyltransferase [Alphaproteobacteria bacterium]|nr:MAG: GNAT family acetyltransferase [Alphaproteobacteria bacterium]
MAPVIVAATPERWPDVVTVFADCADGRRCWCAYWYLPNRDFKAGWGEANRATLEREVLAGAEPGLLAYVDGEPAAWALVGPRDRFDRLNRSKALAPVDDRPAWAVACFIVRRKFRRQGLTRDLIAAAVDFARRRGARLIESYPVDAAGKLASWDLFLGPIAAFRELGFAEVARRLPRRPILRLEL